MHILQLVVFSILSLMTLATSDTRNSLQYLPPQTDVLPPKVERTLSHYSNTYKPYYPSRPSYQYPVYGSGGGYNQIISGYPGQYHYYNPGFITSGSNQYYPGVSGNSGYYGGGLIGQGHFGKPIYKPKFENDVVGTIITTDDDYVYAKKK